MEKFHGKQVCSDPKKPGQPEHFQTDTSCPAHCLKDITLKIFENGRIGDFYIDEKGHLIVNKTEAFQVSTLSTSVPHPYILGGKTLFSHPACFSFHFQNMTVENYCVTYHCNDDVGDWMVHLKSCLCMKNDSVIFDKLGENNYLMINLITKTLYTIIR